MSVSHSQISATCTECGLDGLQCKAWLSAQLQGVVFKKSPPGRPHCKHLPRSVMLFLAYRGEMSAAGGAQGARARQGAQLQVGPGWASALRPLQGRFQRPKMSEKCPKWSDGAQHSSSARPGLAWGSVDVALVLPATASWAL